MSTSPTAHSIFGASSAKRWMTCPASIARSVGIPNESSPYAAEGTMLHDIAANALMVYRNDPSDAFAWNDLTDLTAEQIGVVRAYVETIQEDTEWGEGEPWQRFMIEERVSLPGLHPQFFGTNDCSVVRRRRLTVYDLKCGAGVAVEVDEDGKLNPQLGYYMLGAIEALGGSVALANVTLPPGVDELEIVVVQPRLGGVKRRDVAVTELLDLAGDLWFGAALAARGDAPALGGKHCKFCPAKRSLEGRRCPDLDAHAKRAARLEFAPEAMTDDDLAAVLSEAEAIEVWLSAVREEAKARMQAGAIAPGWGLRTGRRGNRNWVDATKAQLALMEWGFDPDHVAPRKLVSPAEVERLAKLHHGEEIDLGDMVERKEGAVTVARVKAADEFGAVKAEEA